MAEPMHLDHITATVLDCTRPVAVGPRANVTVGERVTLTSDAGTHDPDELVLEDIALEVHAAQRPFVVGLGAKAYLHPGVRALSVIDGGEALLAPGAGVDEIDQAALASGQITVSPWRTGGGEQQ